AARHGITNKVRIIGPQSPSELLDWYNAADLFCLATSREGSANVLLEALACGLPCVTTPVGGNPDVIATPDVGILAEADPQTMDDAIACALRCSWDRKKIARHMCSRTWRRVAEKHYSNLWNIAGRDRVAWELQK